MFEEFIRNERTDRYNIMCYIDANKKIHQNMMTESEVVHYHQIQQHKH